MTTSQTAYEEIKPNIPNHHAIILKAFKKGEELTSLDVSNRCLLGYHAVARRMKELVNLYEVETTTKHTSQNRMMYKII